MKIRNGFISKSSSSSFVCFCCKEEGNYEWTTIYDLIDETGEECGHQACECMEKDDTYLIPRKEGQERDEYRCPICYLDKLQSEDVLNYLISAGYVDIDLINEEIRGCGSRKALLECISDFKREPLKIDVRKEEDLEKLRKAYKEYKRVEKLCKDLKARIDEVEEQVSKDIFQHSVAAAGIEASQEMWIKVPDRKKFVRWLILWG